MTESSHDLVAANAARLREIFRVVAFDDDPDSTQATSPGAPRLRSDRTGCQSWNS
jgi:hypothetical protein